MIAGVRAAVAAAMLMAAERRVRLPRPVPALPSPCPPELLARNAMAPLRAAVIASLWAPGKRCLVQASYPEVEEAPMLLPEKVRTQRASGHWARLAAAGYVFADSGAEPQPLPAPVVRLAPRRAA